MNYYRPQQSWGKVVFLHVSVTLFRGGGGIPACIAGGIPACLAAGLQEGWYPSMPCRFPGPHPGGKLRGLARGVSPGPYPRGMLRDLAWGVSRPTQWVSRPTPRGVSRPTPGVGGCIPAYTEADPPTATAVGGTHPTGIHSCFVIICLPFIYSGFI